MKRVAVIGLGYVGLPLAVELGKKHKVIGFDINKSRVCQLQDNIDITRECLPKDIKDSVNLSFTDDEENLSLVDIFIITVPTPITIDQKPNLEPLIKASELVARYLSNGNIVIYESTVYPGATEEVCAPILEKFSNLKFNSDFFCGYSPERIVPADKKNTITKIVKIVSGSTKKTMKEISALYGSIIEAGIYEASSIKVAEAAKVIENCQRDLNIGFVNELSKIFNKIGIDTKEVLDAASTKWNFHSYNPGLVGGHCIGVDPYYLTYKAQSVGVEPQVILAGRRINDTMHSYVIQEIFKNLVQKKKNLKKLKVGILGITFKENCPDIRNSKIIEMVKELNHYHIHPLVHDPEANADELFRNSGIKLYPLDDKFKVDVLIIAVGHQIYRSLNVNSIKSLLKPLPMVVDIKSLFRREAFVKEGIDYFSL